MKTKPIARSGYSLSFCRSLLGSFRKPRPRGAGLGVVWLIGLLGLGILWAGSPALSATAEAPKRPAESAEGEAPESSKSKSAEPDFVPMPDIGVRSEQVKQQLKESLFVTEPSAEEKRALEIMPDLRLWVNRQLRRSEAVRRIDASVTSLDQLQAGWDQVDRRLEETQKGLKNQGAEVEQQIQKIRKIKVLWTSTREKAIALDVDPDVIRQIDEVLQAASFTTRSVNDRQARVLALQSDVASLSELARGDENLISDARNQAVRAVLERQTPPIWSSAFWAPEDGDSVLEDLNQQFGRDRHLVTRYWKQSRQLIGTFWILVLILMGFMWFVRREIDASMGNDPEIQAVRAIFRRPIALSLLIAFFSALFVFRDLAVGPLGPLFGAATLIPAVVVLRQIVDRPIFPMLSVGMAVYFVHQLHQFVEPAPVISRVIFLLNLSALALWTSWTLRPSQINSIPAEVASKYVFRMIGRVLRIISITAFACVGAKAIGFGSLADLVGGTLMIAIYGAIVLYGTVLVVDGLLVFFMRVRPLSSLALVRRNRALLRDRANLLMWIGAWLILIQALLSRLEVWDQTRQFAEQILSAQIPLPEVTLTVGNVFASILVFVGALWLSRFIQFVLSEEVFDSAEVETGRPYAIKTLLHYAFMIGGFIFAVTALGFDANKATLLTGAFGVGVGFGLQTIVSNFISGLILLTERPIQVGDTVEMGMVSGSIQRIGIRSSTVRTWQGAEVIVPNAKFIAEEVTNWTKSDRRRRFEIAVGVAYGSDPEQIMPLLAEAAAGTDGVLENPEPYVLFQGFGDSSLDFEVRAWTNDFDHFTRIRSRICVSINRALSEAGVEIPFPQRDIHLRGTSTD